MQQPTRLTRRDIAKACGVRLHQLRYALDEYGIPPAERIAGINLYSPDQIPTIRAALKRIAQRRFCHA